jgi:quinol monooxygenase YgiN
VAIAVTLDLKVQPGKGAGLVEMFKSLLVETRTRQGALRIELVVDQDDSDHLVIYENWETKEDHQSYMGWRQERGDLDKLGEVLAAPPTVTYFDIADPA